MRTRLSKRQLEHMEGEPMKYIELNKITRFLQPGEIFVELISLPESAEGLLIQTIRVTANVNRNFFVDLIDDNDNIIYRSVEEQKMLYDIVSIPHKPASKKVRVKITNSSPEAVRYQIEIKGVKIG